MGKMKKGKTTSYEDLAKRIPIPGLMLNNFTSSPPSNTSMTVYESGHKVYCEPGWYTTLRIYDHYLIHYILSGKGTYMTPSGQYAVKKGDLFLIRPDEAIHYRADYADPWTYYWIGFNGHEAFNIMNLCGFSDTCLVQFYGEDPILKNLFHKLAYPNYQGISREYELLGYLYEIFSLFLQKWSASATSSAELYISHAVEYIQSNYPFSDLQVSNVADYVGIDRTYLYRIFYDFFHLSVQDYIHQFRLNKAKSLLKFTDASINLVASYCGFENQSYFSTVFKKQFNMTPMQYRKQEKETQSLKSINNEITPQSC